MAEKKKLSGAQFRKRRAEKVKEQAKQEHLLRKFLRVEPPKHGEERTAKEMEVEIADLHSMSQGQTKTKTTEVTPIPVLQEPSEMMHEEAAVLTALKDQPEMKVEFTDVPAVSERGQPQTEAAEVPLSLVKDTMSAARMLMRAVRVFEFGGPDVLKVHTAVQVPKPEDDQVLIKVHACGVNPVETYIRAGVYARVPALPYTPGTDVAGIIEAVGKGVTKYKKGDRVFTSATVTGGYAEYAVASTDTVFPLPEKLSYKQGAAIYIPYFTAYRALILKARPRPGESVLVHGASGGVGIAACQIARAHGFKVLGTAGTDAGLKLVLENGAHKVFNHRDENYVNKIKEAVGEQGVNVIIEMLSNVNLNDDLQLLSRGGQVIIVGSRGPVEINPRDTMMKESSIIGVSLFLQTPEEMEECAAALLAGMESGWLKPVIGPEYPLEKASQAHEDIINSSGALGKMVLIV